MMNTHNIIKAQDRHDSKKNPYIFPSIGESCHQLEGSKHHYELFTYVRTKHEGVWYLTIVKESCVVDTNDRIDLNKSYIIMWRRLVYNAVMWMTLGKVDTEYKDRYGYCPYELDLNQEEETERLDKYNILRNGQGRIEA